MNDFYKEFPVKTDEEWLDLTRIQLKGKTIEEALHQTHPIEEIDYVSYGFNSNQKKSDLAPGEGNFLRGTKTTDNDWVNNIQIPHGSPKEMNAYALRFLMNGATGIKIDLANFNATEIREITKEIGLNHISSTFIYSTKEQFDWLNENANVETQMTAINTGKENFGLVKHAKNALIEAIDVQYAGGNVSQEIAYALHKGHETLFQLMKSGLSVDEAAKQIKFLFGIGSNYFFELNKFRVFRALWSTVVAAYQPKEADAAKAFIEVETGFINKSLQDPHTNLLRQTTEVASAVLAGVDEVTVQPYNAWSKDSSESKEKAQHLGITIALLLKEESYLDKVIDPAAGAYIIDELYEQIKDKAWKLFQELENKGLDFLKEEIQRIAAIRIRAIENQSTTLIGVNKYFNIETVDSTWDIQKKTAFGTPVVLEINATIEK